MCGFFFSSRRRHTRFSRDWSSDVCSSDLAVRRRLEGDRAQISLASPEDWPPVDDQSETAWEQARAALDRGHRELRDAIARVPESRLDEPILESMSTVYVTLHGIIQHDLYHAGQISMLKKAVS